MKAKEQNGKDTGGRKADDLPRLERPPRPGGSGSGSGDS